MSTANEHAMTEQPLQLLILPETPAHLQGSVKAWREPVEILTYQPDAADKNPMFLEKRVYQGSSGRVYPLPFIDRVATEPETKLWQAIHIENEYLRLMILPELGGRIHVGYDKTTGYDFFYRQNVIKPALVGLAGPWISGGVEFNWPQHHRPATYMPVETEIEQQEDGAVTVWCSDHDPMLRMKGMHGICLRPDRAVVELKVRLFNRTPYTQTFLWWANVATRVHEHYQSFFPTDVRFVADHAKRAVTSFPQCDGSYYGVNYGERAVSGVAAEEAPAKFVPDGSYPANDLSWYANIPVPTSYMITGTKDDFFGGYDHRTNCGIVHVANHHIAPGKKQWTWGNHDFGYAWDRSLTDDDGPYIELMAGVYTDNQPDFSYLAPWETKTFTQNWYPIHVIGTPQAANMDAALSVRAVGSEVQVGLYLTHSLGEVTIALRSSSTEIDQRTCLVDVAHPICFAVAIPPALIGYPLWVEVRCDGRMLIEYDEAKVVPMQSPDVAVEPLPPSAISNLEELYLTGLHLYQYRHATLPAETYWQEALARDPGESRCNNALGLWRLGRGEFDQAATHFEAAISRLTRLNPNPYDGEAFYNLGVTERLRGRDQAAYDALYKATWNMAWRAPAYLALAEIDATRGDWAIALDHLDRSLSTNCDNLNALNLRVVALTRLGRGDEAIQRQLQIKALDHLDLASRYRDGIQPANGQESLDLAFDLLRAGLREEAAALLRSVGTTVQDGSLPMVLFTLATIESDLKLPTAEESWARAHRTPLDYCFPARLEEMVVLQAAIAAHPEQAAPHYLLGNWLYDRRRHAEAIEQWEIAAALNAGFATVWRNLGIALFNVRGDSARARESFDRAFALDPSDGRVLYERDQLWKRIGIEPSLRLTELCQYPELTARRDDLSVELATLYNHLGQPERALQMLLTRRFQPWEGGEGLVLAQYIHARLQLGQAKLHAGDPAAACKQFEAALTPPENLSEARHLLANQSDLYYWIGVAHESLGDPAAAAFWWQRATSQRGDFEQMAVRSVSAMSYWTAMAQRKLGLPTEAHQTLTAIYDYSLRLEATEAKIDYFATSLPTMLLFEDDLAHRNRIEARSLRAQALAGLDRNEEAVDLLTEILAIDRNHAVASDLLHQIQPAFAEAR